MIPKSCRLFGPDHATKQREIERDRFNQNGSRSSAKWYSENLGFELLHHFDEAGWSEMRTKTEGVTLGLGEQSKPAPGNTVPVFGVLDIKTARTALERAGVKFDGETETVEGMVATATFYDPDGNALMLAQDLSKA